MALDDSGYAYDLFISYRCFGRYPRFVGEFLRPALEHFLHEELARPARLFVNTSELEDGVDWPQALANAHATSRAMAGLFSHAYPVSPWCRAEFELMRAREDALGMRSTQQPAGLIIGAVVHGREHLHPELKRIQTSVDLSDLVAVCNKESGLNEELNERVRGWAPAVADTIRRAPDRCEPAWAALARERFELVVDKTLYVQRKVPSLGMAT